MPAKRTLKRAQKDKREGKAASTQAGEFVREEIQHIREGKHGARSARQAIAIGLSKARRAGVDLPPPKKGEASEETRRKAQRDNAAGAGRPRKAASGKTAAGKAAPTTKAAGTRKPAAPSRTRSRAVTKALEREGSAAASTTALSRQAKAAARKRPAASRSAAARKAARTKGAEGRSQAARKAAQTRARNQEPRRKHNGASARAH